MATSVRLDPAIEARIDALAKRTGRTKAYYLRELIEQGIDDMEDFYDAVEISARVKRGEEKTRPWTDVREELGLDS